MDTTCDESGNVESTHREMEAPMDPQVAHDIGQATAIPALKLLCVHQRLIDDVRSRSGKPTGEVRCLECGTIFDDPHRNLD